MDRDELLEKFEAIHTGQLEILEQHRDGKITADMTLFKLREYLHEEDRLLRRLEEV